MFNSASLATAAQAQHRTFCIASAQASAQIPKRNLRVGRDRGRQIQEDCVPFGCCRFRQRGNSDHSGDLLIDKAAPGAAVLENTYRPATKQGTEDEMFVDGLTEPFGDSRSERMYDYRTPTRSARPLAVARKRTGTNDGTKERPESPFHTAEAWQGNELVGTCASDIGVCKGGGAAHSLFAVTSPFYHS